MNNDQLIQRLTSSEEQHAALHFAFYNALLFVLTGICLSGLYAIYKVMYMFLTPLLWATLVGTILFPAKKRCNAWLNEWISKLDDNDTPLLIGIVLLPYQCLGKLADYFFFHATRIEGAITLVLYMLIKVLDYGNFVSIIGIFSNVYNQLDAFISFYTKRWMLAFTVLYLSAFMGWIYVQDRESINKKLARFFSVPLWIFALCFISSFCGPLKPLAFILCSVVLSLIAAGVIAPEETPKTSAELKDSKSEKEVPGVGEVPVEPQHKSVARALSGDSFIQIILGLCVILFAARHDLVIVVIFFLGIFAVLRKIGHTVGLQKSFGNMMRSLCDFLARKLDLLIHITIAGHLREFVKFLFTSDRALRNSLRSSLDLLSSIFVMCFLAFTFIFLVVFSAVQLHNETSHLLKLASNVLSKQPEWLLMSAKNYTEGTISEQDIDNYVNQAYIKGRELLAENIRKLVDSDDVERAELFEKQVMQFVDELYRMWVERGFPTKNTTVASSSVLVTKLKSANLAAVKAELMNILKENVETILNILRSLWAVVMLNVSLVISFLHSIGGVVLGFGLNVVNFFIEIVVFLTAVYYLLASSKERWLPLKWISDAVPRSSDDAPLEAMAKGHVNPSHSSFSSNDITNAIENAISGVFVLSAKMAIFYGLYTYFVHSLFDLNIVFLPSILATIFGAIPIMAPYTVSAIGIFELFFVRGETAAAIVFFLASAAPLFFADPAFYKELKGSHPYVTGLSIVGGIYWLGLQGAIFGPIVLCSMLVLFNVYTRFTKKS